MPWRLFAPLGYFPVSFLAVRSYHSFTKGDLHVETMPGKVWPRIKEEKAGSVAIVHILRDSTSTL